MLAGLEARYQFRGLVLLAATFRQIPGTNGRASSRTGAARGWLRRDAPEDSAGSAEIPAAFPEGNPEPGTFGLTFGFLLRGCRQRWIEFERRGEFCRTCLKYCHRSGKTSHLAKALSPDKYT